MGHQIFFFSVTFITLVAFSSGKQLYISDDWVNGIEHRALLRPRAKQIPCLHFFDGSLRANRNLQQIDVCIKEFLRIEALSEIQYFIFLSKKISAEFIIEQKL